MKKIFILFFAISILGYAQDGGKYSVENLSINTKYSEYGPAFAPNKQLVFSALKHRTVSSYIIKNIGDPPKQYYDLYVADIDIDGKLINKTKYQSSSNSRYHDSDVVFTSDNKTVYFTRNNYYDSELHKDSKENIGKLSVFKADVDENGKWSNITQLPFNSTEYSCGHPALSNDDKKLFFVSDRPGTSGKTDIYMVNILPDNQYSEPVNVKALNSSAKEMFLFMDKNNVLYFASDRNGGQGGLDIYASQYKDKVFTEPVHLPAPINSEADDFALVKDVKSKSGYFSSNRSGGMGDDDIYYFEEEKPIEFVCKQDLVAKVFDAKTLKPLKGAQLSVFYQGKKLDEVNLGEDGTYTMNEVKCKDTYNFKAHMKGYHDNEVFIHTPGKTMYTNKANIAMELIPEPPKPVIPDIILGPVYFDFDKYHIRHSIDADEELDKIVDIMNKYPEMIVRIESHTDSRGDAQYNLMLSQKRAEATKDYMVRKGISADRIVGVVGKGETVLANNCSDGVKCTEAEHQMNRRTVFIIVNPESYKKQ